MVALKQQKQNTGKKLNVANSTLTLMVPEALEKEAVIITGSTKRSGTGNNDLNFYSGKIDVFINPWIGSDVYDIYGNAGSDTAWYLIARNSAALRFNWDMSPSYKTWENEDHDTMWTKVKFRGNAFWTGWIGTWGSKGDASAYSSQSQLYEKGQ